MSQRFAFWTSCLLSALLFVHGNSFAADDHRHFQKGQTLYVHSAEGMNLRITPSRKSGRASRMPYSARVTVVTNSNQKYKVKYGNINGHWVHVQLGHIKGYAFSGLLSRFPTPASTSYNDYQQKLQQKGLGDFDSEQAQIIAAQANLSISEASLIDGFLIARKLFGIPSRFKFPHTSALRVTVVTDPRDMAGKSGKSVQVMRDANGFLNEIIYFDKQHKWSYRSSIKSRNDGSIELQTTRSDN